jgi:iron complex outermembrane recepter protein
MDSSIRIDRQMEITRLPEPVWRSLLALLLLLTAFLAGSRAWAADSKVKFNLPADEFPKAILEFYHQSKIEVLFLATDALRKIRTHPVVGELEPRTALTLMLAGTGLTFDFDESDHSVIVRQPPQVAAGQAAAPPEVSVHRMAALEPTVGHNLKLEEVVVTGSLIHGVMDVIAPLVYVTRKDLSQASYATVQDALYSLPINSPNAPREDRGLNNNLNYGAGVNLRALGTGATLVLVNGQRQPLSGVNGEFVDVSNIPWSAVQRIEVLPDGASASYGADAIAGVVNIILRDDFQGAETQFRLGGAPGGRDEILISQLLGTRWDTGKAMLDYQYSDATSLGAADRGYAANADKRPYGGGDYRSIYSNPGNILNPITLQPVYGIPGGQSGASLTPAALSPTINLENGFTQYELFPERRSHSIYVAGSQEAGAYIELFANGRFTQRDTIARHLPQQQVLRVPSTNPFFVDPFGGSPYTAVAYSFLRDLGPTTFAAQTQNYMGTVGAKFRLGDNWRATLSESYGRETLVNHNYNVPDQAALSAALADTNSATAFNAFGGVTNPATLAAIRRDFILHAASGIETTSFIADGPILNLPAGAAKLAVGVERREETLDHDVPDPTDPTERTVPARYGRHVTSAFTELSLPLVGSSADQHATPRLELTLAGRFEDYSDFGHTFNPQVRLRWIPLESLKLRGSWGRSFRAPKLDDLYDSSQNAAFLTLLPDPRSPSGRSTILGIQGDNPTLKQETATTWTAGIDVVPVAVPGLKLSLTYYAIDYEGQIAQPASAAPFDILVQESEWAPVITRNPTAAQIAAVCNSPEFQGSRAGCLISLPAAIVDFRLANLASTKVSGLDIDARQSLDSGVGEFRFGVNGSYVFRFDQAVTNTSPSTDILNTFDNPLALRLRATAEWNRHQLDEPGLGLNLAINHTNGYDNPGSSLVPRIHPWTTVDLQLRYRTPKGDGFWADTEVALNTVNVFNQSPPFADNLTGYDQGNAQPLGRVVSVYARKKW